MARVPQPPARATPLAALALALLLPTGASAYPGLHVLYAPQAGADAIHDGAPGVAGLREALRQAPIFDNPRWPTSRQVAKISGRELSRRGEDGMLAMLRAGIRSAGGLVGVDEMSSVHWGPAQSADLARALDRLGPLARRVVIYVSPGLVAQVGRRDASQRLDARRAATLGALTRAGAVMLVMYRGGAAPMSRQEFADYPTRWLGRFEATGADARALHLVIGPDQGFGQAALWTWARGTPAGRRILRNGASAYGLRTSGEGRAWLAEYRAFQADPDTPPVGGDTYVPTAGALRVTRLATWRVRLTLARPGRAVMRLQPLTRGIKRRVVAKIVGPGSKVVRIPRRLHPGRYRIITVALGGGVREVSNIGPVVVKKKATKKRARRR